MGGRGESGRPEEGRDEGRGVRREGAGKSFAAVPWHLPVASITFPWRTMWRRFSRLLPRTCWTPRQGSHPASMCGTRAAELLAIMTNRISVSLPVPSKAVIMVKHCILLSEMTGRDIVHPNPHCQSRSCRDCRWATFHGWEKGKGAGRRKAGSKGGGSEFG